MDDKKLSSERAFEILKTLAEDSDIPAETRRKIAIDILHFNGAVGDRRRGFEANVTETQLAHLGRVLLESETIHSHDSDSEGALGTLEEPREKRPLLPL